MPTGVYKRSAEQREQALVNLALGRGWNRGKKYKYAKTVPNLTRSCAECGNSFERSKYQNAQKFCSKECKKNALKKSLKTKYRNDKEFQGKVVR